MVNPSYLQNFEIQQRGFDFRLFILPDVQVSPDPDANQQEAAGRPSSEEILVPLAANGWAIYDGVGAKANLVARAQAGMQKGASTTATSCFNIFTIAFTDERFKGSSFKVLGTPQDAEAGEDELAIIGGTGEFTYAQGVATLKTIQPSKHGGIKKLRIRALCLQTIPPKLLDQPMRIGPMRIGPWGGNGGIPFDIEEKPRRLDSVTIKWGLWIDSLAFSYKDEAGERLSAGPWGGSGGHTTTTITWDSTEIVTQVSGTTRDNAEGVTFVQSLTFVTSRGRSTTCGDDQKTESGTTFNVPLQDNNSVVGFFVRARQHVNAVGIYVHPSVN